MEVAEGDFTPPLLLVAAVDEEDEGRAGMAGCFGIHICGAVLPLLLEFAIMRLSNAAARCLRAISCAALSAAAGAPID